MYLVQIERYDRPDSLTSTCLFPASANLPPATAIWRFMVDHLEPGWQVSLLAEEGQIVRQANSGDTKKLGPELG